MNLYSTVNSVLFDVKNIHEQQLHVLGYIAYQTSISEFDIHCLRKLIFANTVT